MSALVTLPLDPGWTLPNQLRVALKFFFGFSGNLFKVTDKEGVVIGSIEVVLPPPPGQAIRAQRLAPAGVGFADGADRIGVAPLPAPASLDIGEAEGQRPPLGEVEALACLADRERVPAVAVEPVLE